MGFGVQRCEPRGDRGAQQLTVVISLVAFLAAVYVTFSRPILL